MEPGLTVIRQENSSQQQQDDQGDQRGHTQLHTPLLPICGFHTEVVFISGLKDKKEQWRQQLYLCVLEQSGWPPLEVWEPGDEHTEV